MPTTKAFDEILKSVKKTYLGKQVPEKYKKEYGKIYNKKEILPLALKIAKSRGIPVENKNSLKGGIK